MRPTNKLHMDSLFLYLDESGDGGWTKKYGGNSKSPYFVYAGAILTPEQNYEIKDKLNQIINIHFDWVRPDEIHFADLVHQNDEFGLLSEDEKESMSNDIFDLILDVEPVLMATVVDKDRMKERYGDNANPPKRYGFRSTVERFHKHLVEHDSIGVVTIDAQERTIDSKLRDLIYSAQDTGIKLPGASSRRDTTLPRLMDTITVTPSEMSSGIQLADVVAYQVHHQYKYRGDSYGYKKIEHLFRDPQKSYFTEPSVIPKRR